MGHVIIIGIAVALTAFFAWLGKRKREEKEREEARTPIAPKSAVSAEEAEKNKEEAATSERIVPQGEARLRAIVRALPVEVLKDKGTEFLVQYQGGTFILTYIPFISSIKVTMFNIGTATYAEMPAALAAANYINEGVDVWKCHAHIKKKGTTERPLCVSLSCLVPLFYSAYAIKNIKEAMTAAFDVARHYTEFFEQEKKDKYLEEGNLHAADFNNKLTLAKNKWEALPHDAEHTEPEDGVDSAALTIGRLMAQWVDGNFGEPLSLRILAEGKVETYTTAEQILAFNIYDFIYQYHAEEWSKDFAVQLTTEHEGLLFCLRRADQCTANSLFYKMAVYRTELDGNYDMEGYFSKTTIEVRLSTLNNDLWETKYMIEEALAKEKKEGFDSLTEQEKAIVAMTTYSLQAHMYWGQRYYNAGCFYQSLEHFRRAYRHCKDNWYRLNEHGRNAYFTVCYYLGFVYLHMKMMEKAHYFLHTAAETHNTEFTIEYINCLCNMKDPGAMSYITQCVRAVNEQLSDKGPVPELLAFREFLERRYVYAQIDLHMYAEARKHLNEMIERGVSVEFAKKELHYLDLRESAEKVQKEENDEDNIQ